MVVGRLATAVHATVTFEDEIQFTGVIVEGRRSESFVRRVSRNKHRCRAGDPIDVFFASNDKLDEAKIGCKMGAKPLSYGQKSTVARERNN